jgi:hypothetical protein
MYFCKMMGSSGSISTAMDVNEGFGSKEADKQHTDTRILVLVAARRVVGLRLVCKAGHGI